MITYVIPCLLGLEKLVADEVKRLGLFMRKTAVFSAGALGLTAPGSM